MCVAVLHHAYERPTLPHTAMPSKHRLSLNLTPEEHREVAALAETSRVSKAWIGRQALIEFLDRYRDRDLQLPLDLGRISRTGNRT